ncbi:MAG: pyridoxamine 5'-phosphate oxidase family protein [Desulfovibrio sp.]|jgi:uncharacterized pyridoxamine 5'-phosphate oxidase family protein|nr:pyridoxamine 5'-phosphate oxidase family protein [Desulfovibrio sp.]
MKAATLLILTLFLVSFPVMRPARAAQENGGKMGIRDVYDFIKGCGHYFLATADGDQPRVRPFGTVVIFEGKLYFQTGKAKNVSKQLAANPKIEICAYDGKSRWIRVQAVAVNDERRAVKQLMLDAYPELKKMYSPDDGNTQVLYLKDATAYFYSSGEDAVSVKF